MYRFNQISEVKYTMDTAGGDPRNGGGGGVDEDGGYRWEGGYEKTWEAIQEDKEGMLDISKY